MTIDLTEDDRYYNVRIPVNIVLDIYICAESKKEIYDKIFKPENNESGFYTDDWLTEDISIPDWMDEIGVRRVSIDFPRFISDKKVKIEEDKEQ